MIELIQDLGPGSAARVGPPSVDAGRTQRPRGLGWRPDWDLTLLAAATLWAALYYAYSQFEWAGIFPAALADLPIQWAAAVLAMQAAQRSPSGPAVRQAWRSFAGASSCYATGSVASFYYQHILGRASFPSCADLAYLGFYVLAFAGAVRLHGLPPGRLERLKLGLDNGTILLGSAALLWYFLLRPLAAGRGALVATLATAYPTGDLVLAFAVLAPLAARSGHVRRQTRVFLTLGFVALFLADVSFVLRSLKGEYVLAHWSDCLWAVSFLLFMVAARDSRHGVEPADPADQPPAAARFVALMPNVAITAVAGLLLFVSHDVWGQPLGGAILASLAVTALVVARQVLASRENRRLIAERVALQGEARFRSLVQNSSDVISIVDADGRYLYLSPSSERILGYPEVHLRAKSFPDLVHPEEVSKARDFLSALAAMPGNRDSTVLRVLHPSGRLLYAEVVGSNLASDPNVNGLLLTVRDVTERKDLREAKAAAESASRAKSQFLANMSHEIRTPLNGVLGTTELLMDSGLTQGQRRLVELARSSGESLLSIVDDILDFSRIEAGRLEMEQVSFDLRETVEGVVGLLAERARAKDVELFAQVADDVPDFLRGDPGRLRQVLVNLVGNAVKFTPQGEIVVRVGVAGQVGEASCLEFEVRDTGIGIPPDALSRIFDAFAQADGSTTRRYGGTGLGLAICKQLVGLMGGEIAVESALGVGTRFRFTAHFGSEPAAGDAAAESPRRLILERGLGRQTGAATGSVQGAERFEGRVLLVEDSPVNLAVAEGMLGLLGPQVGLAADGSEALGALSRATFDLVLMDCMMPGMDGYAATAELRRRENGSGRRTPVVALTANAMSGDRERCLAAGMDDYLSKPFRQEELRQLLARWLPTRKVTLEMAEEPLPLLPSGAP